MKYSNAYWEAVTETTNRIPHVTELYRKTLLITGGTGLICSAVADVLLELNRAQNAGIKIVLAGRSLERTKSRFSAFAEGVDYSFLPYDAMKNEPLPVRADYAIHGASNADPGAFSRQPVETMLCNFIGLNALLEMATEKKIGRALYISSSEVYGQNCATPYDEDSYGVVDLLNPRACYPSSKRAAETLCAAYAAEYGVDAVIVRPGHIYGPGMTKTESRAASQFLRAAVNGENIVMKSAGTQLRSHCHSLDCASAILTVLLNGERGNAYNISNPDSVSTVREFAEAVAECAGVEIRFENPSDQEARSYNLMSNSALRSDKLEGLGWKGLFDLKRGIVETIQALKESR